MKIVYCIPGKEFSDRFLQCWTELLVASILKGHTPYLRNTYTSNVYLCRNAILRDGCLAEGFKRRENLPFGGADYDYMMWIDSDMVYKPEDVWRLIEHDKDIVSGSAMINPGERQLNWGKLSEDGKCNFVKKPEVPNFPRDEKGLCEVDFVGFAFMLVKRGVFENMLYPWFHPKTTRYGDNIYFPSEDIGWCHSAKERGFKIYVDPEVHIGHEKPVVMIG